MDSCAVEGCERPAKTRGWCVTHYSRWRRTGEVGTSEIAIKGLRRECHLEGCLRDATSRGLCGMHYLRLLRHGTVERRQHPRWSTRDELTYDAAHDRVKRYRGRASEHSCSECGEPAEDWAYQHHAENALVDDLGRPFSDDIADYAPMCRDCHRTLDMAMSWRQQGGDHLFIVTVEEAAQFVGVSVPTVRSWMRRGILKPIRPNVKPLMVKYADAAAARDATRSEAWRTRHADAVSRWRVACAS